MANELDELMNKDPLDLTQEDLQAIVNYHRRQRMIIAKGGKVTTEAKPTIDLETLGLIPKQPSINRRA
jgi:hypothetical protein